MKLEIGMYVRTKEGKILKCFKSESMNLPIYYVIGSKTNSYVEYQDVKNASHNIIDLIEVGDYVNGLQVIEVREHLHNDIEIVLTNGSFNWSFSKNESDYKIKSIVTKEQFEQMQYKVGE